MFSVFSFNLLAQGNSFESHAGSMIERPRITSIHTLIKPQLGKSFGITFNQGLTKQISLKYGLRSTWLNNQLISLDGSSSSSFNFRERWLDVFGIAHQQIWQKGLYVDYGLQFSLLNSVRMIETQQNGVTLISNSNGLNIARATSLCTAVGYQYNWTNSFQPFIQMEMQIGSNRNTNKFLDKFFYRFGVFAGVRYFFEEEIKENN
jgi:hypothetical protein